MKDQCLSITFSFSFLFLLITSGKAQTTELKAGINISSLRNYVYGQEWGGYNYHYEYLPGFYVGARAEIDLKKNYFFLTGLDFSLKRFRDSAISYTELETSYFDINYSFYTLAIPILFEKVFSEKISISAGMDLALLTLVHSNGSVTDSASYHPSLSGVNKQYNYNGPVEGINIVGISPLMSISYLISKKIAIDFSYETSLTNLFNSNGGGFNHLYTSGHFSIFSAGLSYRIIKLVPTVRD